MAPANDTLSTLGMPWEVSETVFPSWMLPLMGGVITFKLATLLFSRTDGGSRSVGGDSSLS